VTKEKFILN